MPPALTYAYPPPLSSLTRVVKEEPTLTYHCQPKSTVYIGFTLDVMHPIGLDKYIITRVLVHRIRAQVGSLGLAIDQG